MRCPVIGIGRDHRVELVLAHRRRAGTRAAEPAASNHVADHRSNHGNDDKGRHAADHHAARHVREHARMSRLVIAGIARFVVSGLAVGIVTIVAAIAIVARGGLAAVFVVKAVGIDAFGLGILRLIVTRCDIFCRCARN